MTAKPDEVKDAKSEHANSTPARTAAQTPSGDSNSQKTIQNLTPKRLKIQGNDSYVLTLSPLEKHRKLTEDEQSKFPELTRLEMQNYIRIVEEENAGNLEEQVKTLLLGCAMVVGTVTFVFYQALTDSGNQPANPESMRWLKWGSPISFLLAVIVGIIVLFFLRRGDKGRESLQSIVRWTAQAISLFLILILALGLPSLAFYFFGGGRELLVSQNSLGKLGRLLQLIFICIASLLPALLYFLFDRQQMGTLRQRFEQQIFRLDPNIESLCDVAAKYGRQIDEIYGRETASGEGRLVRGTRWPILVATVVMVLGWMLTLLPAVPQTDTVQPGQLLEFFVPQQSPVTFGFLGAYFFVLNTVLHRYVRADLKPKAYSSITVRILVVFILSWVIGIGLGTSTLTLMVAFVIGVFPESGLTLIRESIRNQTGIFGKTIGLIGSRTRERYPLTELEELDVYDRARLLDEGVTNIEGLAHHDLIDLMLETRIPVPRLVDWIDQAILYLHLEFEGQKRYRKFAPQPQQPQPQQPQQPQREPTTEVADLQGLRNLRTFLRDNCIRTATDFLCTYSKKEQSTLHSRATPDQQTRLRVLSESLNHDEWLDHIHQWRTSSKVKEQILNVSNDKSNALLYSEEATTGELILGCDNGEPKARAHVIESS